MNADAPINEWTDAELKAELARREQFRAEQPTVDEKTRLAESARLATVREAAQQKACADIAVKLEAARALIQKCEVIAAEHGVNFHTPIDVYAMGGVFYGNPDGNNGRIGWSPSSLDC